MVTTKEEAILRDHQMGFIYAQFGILYEIIPEAPWSTHSVEKPKSRPHADGMVGSVNSPTVDSLAKQLHELSVKKSTTEAAKAVPHPKMQMFLHNPPKREISRPMGKRRKGRKVREIKTSLNPRMMLMGERRIRSE